MLKITQAIPYSFFGSGYISTERAGTIPLDGNEFAAGATMSKRISVQIGPTVTAKPMLMTTDDMRLLADMLLDLASTFDQGVNLPLTSPPNPADVLRDVADDLDGRA